jgi:L-seryl-tRNA(Ser) seleniumtransferase
LIHDLGGGVMHDLQDWKLPHEPVVSKSLQSGVHVVTFSGDKVLGGPQAGIIVGRKDALTKIRKNHLMRALRPDKFTLAFLEETLKLYLSPRRLLQHHPVMARLTESQADALARTQAIYNRVENSGIPEGIQIGIKRTKAQLGSGALPLEEFPSAALVIKVKGKHARDVASRLRLADPPLIGYTSKGAVYLDTKAIVKGDEDLFVRSLSRVLHDFGH